MENYSMNHIILLGGLTTSLLIGKIIWNLYSKLKKLGKRIICLEIGGTNIRVLVGDNNTSFNSMKEAIEGGLKIKDYKTKDFPEGTIKEICSWIKTENKDVSTNELAFGISMFGPINLVKGHENYGKVLNTPKRGWTNFHLVNTFSKFLNVRPDQINIELDVNCAAYLEYKHGEHGVNSLAYITIGTGVGVGLVIGGKVNMGLEGPEGGHIRVSRHENDTFEGNCPFHKDCLEGLITNGAIKKRKNLENVDECKDIDPNDPIWNYISYYIAQLCLCLLLVPSVEKIIIGGGIVNHPTIIENVRQHFFKLNNNYVLNDKLTLEGLKKYITRTNFMNNSGILSAFSIIQ